MDEITKQETPTDGAAAAAAPAPLDLNKDTLTDLDAREGDAVEGGAIPTFLVCHTDLCVTTGTLKG